MEGRSLISGERIATSRIFQGCDPAAGAPIETAFYVSGPDDVDRACRAAAVAFDSFRETSTETRAEFLETVAMSTSADAILADPGLTEENFGALSLLFRASDLDQTAAALPRALLPILERKIWRTLAHCWHTGVELNHVMVHGPG